MDIFTPCLLDSDNGKAEVRFIMNSNQVIKIDIYMWKGGIQIIEIITLIFLISLVGIERLMR